MDKRFGTVFKGYFICYEVLPFCSTILVEKHSNKPHLTEKENSDIPRIRKSNWVVVCYLSHLLKQLPIFVAMIHMIT